MKTVEYIEELKYNWNRISKEQEKSYQGILLATNIQNKIYVNKQEKYQKIIKNKIGFCVINQKTKTEITT